MSKIRNSDGRPLTARSVVLSVLLGSDPPQLPVLLLVRTTELFGIAEGTTRTALSRMAANGEVRSVDGVYELAGDALLARQARQTASRAGTTDAWRGDWTQAVIGVDGPRPADERAALRETLRAARLAEVREGVWLRPDNLGPAPVAEGALWFRTTPAEPEPLTRRLWDLDAWSAAAVELCEAMARLVAPLERGDRTALAEGFVLSAAVLRQFQADPLLPDELLPARWPGTRLRNDYDRYDAAYRRVLRDWFAEQR
ncbi:MAG: PaaX family transcriptional regulator C-terminal domain-containing protein [Acidimicrobiales bacterium]